MSLRQVLDTALKGFGHGPSLSRQRASAMRPLANAIAQLVEHISQGELDTLATGNHRRLSALGSVASSRFRLGISAAAVRGIMSFARMRRSIAQ